MVKSRFSTQVYVNTILYLFLIGILVYLYFITNPWENSKKIPVPNIFLLLFILLVVLLFLFKNLKAIKNINITDGSIIINNIFKKAKEITYPEISSIDLFASGYVLGWVTIVVKIELTDGNKIMIPDLYYSNIGEVKQAIVLNFKGKVKSFIIEKKENFKQKQIVDGVQKFAGNPIINFNTIMLIVLVVFLTISTFSKSYRSFDEKWPVFLIVAFVFYITIAILMNYFVITKNTLIVKNHFIPWYSKTYELDNIVSMNFEYPGRRSKSLRITTKDFKSQYYSAGSLREKDWKALKDKIDELGIYFIP